YGGGMLNKSDAEMALIKPRQVPESKIGVVGMSKLVKSIVAYLITTATETERNPGPKREVRSKAQVSSIQATFINYAASELNTTNFRTFIANSKNIAHLSSR
ncbi:unnamed protein product, partial [Ilex paraguariensis]